MNNEKKAVVIIGGYINACSLANAIYKVAPQYQVIIIDSEVNDNVVCMADVAAPHATVYKKHIHTEQEFLLFLDDILPESIQKTILFTNEKWIDVIKNAIKDGRLQNTVSFTGSDISNTIIFDRFEFYRFIEKLNCTHVPKTVDSDVDPFEVFGDSFVFRFKRSWEDGKKIPRLLIIHGREMFDRVYSEFIAQGFSPKDWCYQELLSTVDQHNISVCGWYDDEYHQYAVTRKVVQHPPSIGNGDVVEIISDFPNELVSATQTILSAMQYKGAFEMEFVYDSNTQTYKVIELNPRFWMQHQLVNKATNQALVKRALGIAPPISIPAKDLKAKYWVNGNRMLYYLCKLDCKKIAYALHGDWYPSITQSIRWGFHYRQYKRKMSHRKSD